MLEETKAFICVPTFGRQLFLFQSSNHLFSIDLTAAAPLIHSAADVTIFCNPTRFQIVDARGSMLSSHLHSKWPQLGISTIGDIIDNKGDVDIGIYPLIPPKVLGGGVGLNEFGSSKAILFAFFVSSPSSEMRRLSFLCWRSWSTSAPPFPGRGVISSARALRLASSGTSAGRRRARRTGPVPRFKTRNWLALVFKLRSLSPSARFKYSPVANNFGVDKCFAFVLGS